MLFLDFFDVEFCFHFEAYCPNRFQVLFKILLLSKIIVKSISLPLKRPQKGVSLKRGLRNWMISENHMLHDDKTEVLVLSTTAAGKGLGLGRLTYVL